MGKKLRYEDVKRFVEVDSKSNCRLLECDYRNIDTKMKFLCSCRKEFLTTFSKFRSGKMYCNDCGRNVSKFKGEMTCKLCSKLFKPGGWNQKFCSKDCKTMSLYKEYKCVSCGSSFKSRHNDRKFCSNVCSAKHRYRENNLNLKCDNCKTSFTRIKSKINEGLLGNFCSVKCRRTSLEKSGEDSHKWARVTVQCTTCGNSLYRQPNELKNRDNPFCDRVCYASWLSDNKVKENHWSWRGNPPKDKGPDWPTISERIRKRDRYHCQSCGNPQGVRKLSVHHIIPTRFFDSVEISNKEENLISLCAKCHGKQESHWWVKVPDEYKYLLP